MRKYKPQPPSEDEWEDFIKKVRAFEKRTEELLREVDDAQF